MRSNVLRYKVTKFSLILPKIEFDFTCHTRNYTQMYIQYDPTPTSIAMNNKWILLLSIHGKKNLVKSVNNKKTLQIKKQKKYIQFYTQNMKAIDR